MKGDNMQIIVKIDIPEDEWKHAIAKGQNVEYGENIIADDIKTFDSVSDFQRAISYVATEQIQITAIK